MGEHGQLAFDMPAPDLAKARAQRRANVAKAIADGLICDTPSARNSDPETSHQAADQYRAEGTKAKHQKLIVDCVNRLPGLTVIEIGPQTGLTHVQVGKRTNELVTALRIREGAPRRVGRYNYTTYWPA